VLTRTDELSTVLDDPDRGHLARLTLTNDEIRALTGLGRDKILELLRAGTIPSVRVGRRYLVTRSHLEAFLAGNRR
jgi:excisionase family DNA binding protein